MTNIWKWGPATQDPYTERLAWYTSKSGPGDGSEELIRLRIHPRRYTEFTAVLIERSEQIECDARIHQHGVGPWIMPYWWDACFPTVNLLIDDEVQITGPVGSNPFETHDFQVGNYFVLKNGRGDFHAVEISTASDAVVEGTPHPPSGFLDHGRIVAYPASEAHMPAGVFLRRINGDISTAAVAAEFIDYKSPNGQRYPTTLDGMDVFEVRPDWGEGQDQAYRFMVRRLDGDIGPYVLTDEAGQPFSDRSIPLKFLSDRQGIYDFRLWWQYLGGSATEFLSPTWVSDLDLLGVEENAGVWLAGTSKNISYGSRYDGRANRDQIYLRSTEGNYPLTISDYTDAPFGGDTTFLEFDSVVTELTQDQIFQASWLEKVRMASDELVINHVTNGKAIINMEVKTLR